MPHAAPVFESRAQEAETMRVATTVPSTFWFNVALLIFTLTLVLSLHSDIANERDSHPLYDASDLSQFILHHVAFFISCFSVTVFLLICAAIILGLATVSMELVVEAFRSARLMGREERSRREIALQHTAEVFTEPLDDIYCDTWNYR